VNSKASKAPRTHTRVASTAIFLLLPSVMATPPWLIHDKREQSSDHPAICSPARSLAGKLGASKVKNAALGL
jgi:hypothetical protein